MRIFCDGSGFNGSVSKFGILAEDGRHSSMVFPDNLSNNVMEYSAIILAAVIADEGDEVLSDSQLAVNQIKGAWKVKEGSLFPLRQAAAALIQGKRLKLTWIPREQNKADKIV
jgi:ribonuclease HI